MILTPVTPAALPGLLDRFLADIEDPAAKTVFRRIGRPDDGVRARGPAAARHHRQAVDLALAFGMGVKPGSPLLDFGWDGTALRSETEAYVLLHEVAHFQLAAPERRTLADFGLGPGPETGDRDRAETAARLFGLERDREEAAASLLGILWECELGQPALASFLDQNWLEGVGRRSAAAHFETVLSILRSGGFLDGEFRPTRRLRAEPDPAPGWSLPPASGPAQCEPAQCEPVECKPAQCKPPCGPAKWM